MSNSTSTPGQEPEANDTTPIAVLIPGPGSSWTGGGAICDVCGCKHWEAACPQRHHLERAKSCYRCNTITRAR